MRNTALIIGLAASLAACGQREPAVLKIGDGSYRFPIDAVFDDRNGDDTYVNFDVGRSADGRLTKASISLEFNQQYNSALGSQRTLGSAGHDASIPAVRWIVVGADHKDLSIVKRPWGDVVCDRGSIKVGGYLSCGTTFEEAGAQWQVLFHHDKLLENKNIISEARAVLRKIRV